MADNETTTTPQGEAGRSALYVGVRVQLEGDRVGSLFIPVPVTKDDAARVGRACAALSEMTEVDRA